ncbi:MAG TPA: integrin alpha, partial [Solirubrobacteraceae bacterium]
MASPLRRCLAVAGAAIIATPATTAALPPRIDLPRQATTRIGPDVASVAPAGDFDGDGHQDVIVGVPHEERSTSGDRGGAYVVYGGPALAAQVDLHALGAAGLRIRGRDPEDPGGDVGRQVAGVGDVNGDGLADVAVTAPEEAPSFDVPGVGGIALDGVTYVVFGRREPGTVELGALRPEDGFAVRGASDAVAGVGDVNGDGLGDVAFGSYFISSEKVPGRVYVLLGGHMGDVPNAEQLGERAWTITGNRGDYDLGSVVDGAGDVDGDGLADLVVASPSSVGPTSDEGPEDEEGPGVAYLVRGRRDTSPLSLGDLGSGGVTVRPGGAFGVGYGAAGPGDVDGDGRPDVVLGAPYGSRGPGPTRAGAVHLLSGATGP